MTHDNLQDCLDKFDCAGMVEEPLIKALRAVVELHKPSLGGACSHCSTTTFWTAYPCPTIQAIEKELM